MSRPIYLVRSSYGSPPVLNRRRSGSKRRLEWADLTVSGTPLNDTTPVRWRDAFGDWEGQAGADVQGVTITRILGDVAWTVPNTVAQEYHWLTMGFEVANASDNYELTMPQRVHRLSDPYRDWMYYAVCLLTRQLRTSLSPAGWRVGLLTSLTSRSSRSVASMSSLSRSSSGMASLVPPRSARATSTHVRALSHPLHEALARP